MKPEPNLLNLYLYLYTDFHRNYKKMVYYLDTSLLESFYIMSMFISSEIDREEGQDTFLNELLDLVYDDSICPN